MRPLLAFCQNFRDKDALLNSKGSYLVLVKEAQSGATSDFNFIEKHEYYTSNVALGKAKWDRDQYTILPSNDLFNSGISCVIMDSFSLIPSIMINIERMVQIREFKLFNEFFFIKNHLLLKALSSKSYDKVMNYETLETLGDTVLKTIITLHLYKSYPDKNEDFMTRQRAELINNKYLGQQGLLNGVQYFLKGQLCPAKKYENPFMEIKEQGE